ncbi:TetR/AcrR family transcriptional regulator [Mycobacterium celatum]|uniref:TetR family transcriptional regulator n=1 Tax=Mycobacterium celatum TaxID=28045 RepID=A0A1X1RX06_MYCCE|nr:TetR/AcrR family transcriptional regulator [Mycobacterium celatum]ORV19705.1 TetR family transcriptional regulator [Mycobacterium celatum]PIB74980.1 TetR/AcrR family transcriptional regulator [Mycobacterium celatum]
MPHPASRGPGRPPAAKAAETRKRIVLAAREVFSERGYDAATFQEIALRADLTRPAINHYFSHKRMLYREVLEQTNELVVNAAIARARREATLVQRISTLLAAAAEADSENRSAARFLVTAVLESQRHPDLGDAETDSLRRTREFVGWAVRDSIEQGELAADTDAGSLTEVLVAVLCGVGFYSGFVESAHEMAAIIDQVERLLAAALRQP